MDTDAARERLFSMLDPELASTAKAMAQVPRHEFVPESYEQFAYDDRAPPTGRVGLRGGVDPSWRRPQRVAGTRSLRQNIPDLCGAVDSQRVV